MIIQVDLLEDLPNLVIRFILEWVNIFADCTLQKEGLLWDKRNILTEQMKTHLFDILAIDDNLTFIEFAQSKQGLKNR